MPGTLAITVGVTNLSIPIKGTNAQINAALKRFAIQRGLATEGRTAAEIGTDVLTEILKTVKDGSIDRQRAELLQAQQAALDATLLLDNDL